MKHVEFLKKCQNHWTLLYSHSNVGGLANAIVCVCVGGGDVAGEWGLQKSAIIQ
jgi:hypothetical protein